jgi:DNA repair protein RecN (Recombination protein N)
MLRLLRIRNLAVLDAVEVEFGPGLNVLTGETGAGKSIIVDAVGLLLGARATADLVRTGETQATVEAVFDQPDCSELVIRREITNQGRSRAYLDGHPATVAVLRASVSSLAELHGQHEHHALLDPQTHLGTLDTFARLGDLPEQVASAWNRLSNLQERTRLTLMNARERSSRLELIDFQYHEIDRLTPVAGEDDELEQERRVLASAEHVRELSETAYDALYEDEQAVLARLATVWRKTEELAGIDPSFEAHLETREPIKSQLEDLAQAFRRRADNLDTSPERLETVTNRLVALEGLKRKYGPSLQEVIARKVALATEREVLAGAGENAERLNEELSEAEDEFLLHAKKLSKARHTAAVPFATALEVLLEGLAMRARFEVRFRESELPTDAWGSSGLDEVEFYLSANPGEDLRPLARIASGGELSRIMLALKTLAAGKGEANGSNSTDRTLVFDEVDAGIGGEVAAVVGEHLRLLAGAHQVLCITHLPQIAAHGTTQFRIEKSVRGDRTTTSVVRLTHEDRVMELARMIGGGSVSTAVKESAAELLALAEAKKKRKSTDA